MKFYIIHELLDAFTNTKVQTKSHILTLNATTKIDVPERQLAKLANELGVQQKNVIDLSM